MSQGYFRILQTCNVWKVRRMFHFIAPESRTTNLLYLLALTEARIEIVRVVIRGREPTKERNTFCTDLDSTTIPVFTVKCTLKLCLAIIVP